MRNLGILFIWFVTGTTPISNNVQFDLINSTNFTFSKVWLAKHSTNVWGKNLIKEPIKSGGKVSISLVNKNEWALWDLRVQYTPKNYEIWGDGFEMLTIHQIEIKLVNGKWDAHYTK